MKKYDRSNSIYIRCSDRFISNLNDICKKYNISQSDVIHIFVYTFHDSLIVDMKDINYYKVLKKCLQENNS